MALRRGQLVGVLLSTAALCLACSTAQEPGDTLTATPDPDEGATSAPAASTATTGSPNSPSTSDAGTGRPTVVDTIATGLAVPWGIAFLPDGSALVTERDSRRLLRIADGDVRQVGTITAAAPEGEGGVLGIAASPDFAEDHAVFVYVTAADDNRVLRYTFEGGRLGGGTAILTGIPRGFTHDGGQLAFGPDGQLYVSTGESGEPELSQDRSSLGGKILRITTDGDPAPGNPFDDSPVWSWGHRNVQGLAFDSAGDLWASEFGDQTWDELNLIRAGANYGWPIVEGRGGNGDYVDPQVVWSTDEASPSGLAYLDGSLYLAGLRGQRLWRIELSGEGTDDPRARDARDFFVGDYGRLRGVAVAPDGMLWVTTSNRDGRGEPAADDDRILVVDPG